MTIIVRQRFGAEVSAPTPRQRAYREKFLLESDVRNELRRNIITQLPNVFSYYIEDAQAYYKSGNAVQLRESPFFWEGEVYYETPAPTDGEDNPEDRPDQKDPLPWNRPPIWWHETHYSTYTSPDDYDGDPILLSNKLPPGREFPRKVALPKYVIQKNYPRTGQGVIRNLKKTYENKRNSVATNILGIAAKYLLCESVRASEEQENDHKFFKARFVFIEGEEPWEGKVLNAHTLQQVTVPKVPPIKTHTPIPIGKGKGFAKTPWPLKADGTALTPQEIETQYNTLHSKTIVKIHGSANFNDLGFGL